MSERSLRAQIETGSRAFGLDLADAQLDQLVHYLLHLERWNRTINLTALPLAAYPITTLDRLIFEPLKSVSLFAQERFRWFDLGSGGGSPAIPLRIALPAASLVMVESRSRKVAFLRDVIRALALSDVEVMWKRVEDLAFTIDAKSVDVLTIRALRIDEQIAASVRHVLTDSGRIVLFGSVNGARVLHDFDIVSKIDDGGVTVLQRRHADVVPRGTLGSVVS